MFHQLVDWAATYVEYVVILMTIVEICGSRYSGRKRWIGSL